MRGLCSYLERDRHGFAISYEICMTMFLTAVVVCVTIYFAQVFQMQRYFADVTSSTCVMASRYGGNDSKAYQIQVGTNTTIEDNANAQLHYIQDMNDNVRFDAVGDGGKYITVSNKPDANGMVHVKMNYRLGDIGWKALQDIVSVTPAEGIVQEFDLPTLMQKGLLLG